MSKIQLYIATYNRPDIVQQTIKSVLNQTFKDFELIISDNSNNDETFLKLKHFKDPRIGYIKRSGNYSGIEHFNLILNEIRSDYFMIFHDDDLMYTNMLEELVCVIESDRDIVAVGSNARIVSNVYKRHKLFFKEPLNLFLKNPQEVIKQYLKDGGISAFPSYLYRKKIAENIKFEPRFGGKYCDASFIIEASKLGKIVFYAKPLMDYYVHYQQDSKINAFVDKLKLISFMISNSQLTRRHKLILRFRIQNLYFELKQGLNNGEISLFSYRYKVLIKLMFFISKTEYFPRAIYLSIYRLLKDFKIVSNR